MGFYFKRLEEIERRVNEKTINAIKDSKFEGESSSGYDSESSQNESDLFTDAYYF